MACDITKGRARECKQNLGGQSSLFLFNYVEDPFTIVDGSGEASGINPLLTVVYQYELAGDLNTLTENQVSDDNTGVTVNTQTLVASLRKQDAATSAEFNLLTYGNAQAVVKDRNGVFHCLGISEGLNWSVDATTGGARTDLNGYTVTGVGLEGALSPKLDDATITAFLALIA
jgi:hypothetical protein